MVAVNSQLCIRSNGLSHQPDTLYIVIQLCGKIRTHLHLHSLMPAVHKMFHFPGQIRSA